MKCAECDEKKCYEGKDCTAIGQAIRKKYTGEDKRIMETASGLEASHYMKLTRLEELIEFCKKMKYKKLGLAFCIGLQEEARTISGILGKEFTVYSVCCKVCGIDKKEFGLPNIKPGRFEATCNPIGQAEVLNEKKTDLNIACGLCMGHDILFSKHSEAPVTTLVVKDRVLAHNPLGAIYSRYYRKNRFGLLE